MNEVFFKAMDEAGDQYLFKVSHVFAVYDH